MRTGGGTRSRQGRRPRGPLPFSLVQERSRVVDSWQSEPFGVARVLSPTRFEPAGGAEAVWFYPPAEQLNPPLVVHLCASQLAVTPSMLRSSERVSLQGGGLGVCWEQTVLPPDQNSGRGTSKVTTAGVFLSRDEYRSSRFLA